MELEEVRVEEHGEEPLVGDGHDAVQVVVLPPEHVGDALQQQEEDEVP